ncbi:PREDICTED: neuroglian-like [Priapulus caudatus]|uniref:Neuroglian-like n=1 Tax=Priapulus caudatus TaxID=37621 RepID=A0ABM1DUK4_PRICU|nr:PREDICTED: neuroglian-like [Priapulus caudatus]
MLLQWDLPIEPNGVVVGYRIGYQRVDGTRIGKQQFREPDLLDPFATSVQLSALEAESKYRITIWPLTGAGVGEPYYVERSTLMGGVPSTPTLSMLSRNQTHVNITWTNWDLTNRPASIYYVVFKKTGEEAWRKTPEQYTRHWIEVFPLQPGTSYTMRVVGVNDQWEAASLPLAINTLGSRKDIGDDSTIASVGSASWFIGMIIALFLLLAVFILMVLLKRRRDAQDAERQVMFPPDNMEYPAGRTGGRYTPDLQPGYTTHAYPVSRNPDPPSSRPTQEQSSVDSSDAKPPIESSDADSFHTDHGESDVVRFNEDGSFVGQYQPKKRRAPPAVPSDSAGGAAAGGGDEATQQSFDTFV